MNSDLVKWAVASRQMYGETISGDLHLVKPARHGVLVAVVDGLGHGKPAAHAAELAIKVAAQCVHEPLTQVLEHCNRRLHETRGVVMSLAFFNPSNSTMTWLGVGNVEGLLVRAGADGNCTRQSLMRSAGVVGVRLPHLRTCVLKVVPGDTLIFATDGIRPGFKETVSLPLAPDKTAQNILDRDRLQTDDALVLVAMYRGRPQ